MKHLKYYILLLVVLTLSSCSDYLDIKPKGFLIPEKIEDFENMLNVRRQIDNLYERNLGSLNDNFSYKGAARGTLWNYSGVYEKNLYSFTPGQIYTGTETTTWGKSYEYIYVTNYIIKNLPEAIAESDADETRKANVLADARMLRAERYFILVNYYAKQYNEATAENDLGVPIVLEPNVNTTIPARASVQEVYDFILNEIMEAKDNLPEYVDNTMRFSKPAALAFLAKVYFQMEKYDLALENAEMVLNNYSDYSLIDYNNNADFPSNSEPYIRKDSYKYASTISGVWKLALSDDYLSLFPGGYPYGNDLRTWYNMSLNRPTMNDSYYSYVSLGYIDYVGLSVQEMMLIAAESKARNNELTDALSYLNELRMKRFVTGSIENLISSDQLEVLTWIVEERRREMPFSLRLLELKRLDNDPDFAKQIIHKQGDNTFTLEIHDEKFVLPVPPEVLRFNPEMKQYSRK